jgi:hypothetical protein
VGSADGPGAALVQQRLAFVDEVAGGHQHGLDAHGRVRGQAELHLHRLQHQQVGAGGVACARRGIHLHDAAGHGGDEPLQPGIRVDAGGMGP